MPGLPLAPTGTTPFTNAGQEQAYIEARAKQYGLDPSAVLAVAAHEGVTLPAEVGDNGTSFGPWQLHVGGALPASVAAQGATYANDWANSPVGIDYALGRIRSVAAGASGANAIHNIVYLFERPANPASEYANAVSTYNAAKSGGGFFSDVNGVLRHVPGVAQVEGVAGAVDSTAKFLGKITDPAFVLRGLQVVAGGFLVLVGIYLLARQVGLAPDAPSVVQAAAVAVPK